jgi:lipopolysaccharide/colanic/teichoic acid biosynthesis glycosyltransferase
MYRHFWKRVIDFTASVVLFLLLSPVFILITIMLVIISGSSPFFFQIRPGKHAKLFRLIKFKTMNEKRDAQGNLLPDADRLTPIGIFLRKTSLDEIPQLLNVIIGDMSLIGPRPLLPEYLPHYSPLQARRHEVMPGITGWAQVNGRNNISWDKKFAYDVWYVDHLSFALDMKIYFLTLWKVVNREGINSADMVTVEKFTARKQKPADE